MGPPEYNLENAVKLFNRKAINVPAQSRPDYDSIARMEKEFKLDDEGFNERYDEMLIDEFNKENANSKDEFKDRIEKMYDLFDSMFSVKYRMYVTDLIKQVTESRRIDVSPDAISRQQAADILRARMIEAGKRRKR